MFNWPWQKINKETIKEKIVFNKQPLNIIFYKDTRHLRKKYLKLGGIYPRVKGFYNKKTRTIHCMEKDYYTLGHEFYHALGHEHKDF